MKKKTVCELIIGFVILIICILPAIRVYASGDGFFIQLKGEPKDVEIDSINSVAIVLTEEPNGIELVDLKTRNPYGFIKLNVEPEIIGIDEELNIVLIGADKRLSFVDIESRNVVGSLEIKKEINGLAVDAIEHTAYISTKHGWILKIDIMSQMVIDQYRISGNIIGIDIDPELKLIALLAEGSARRHKKHRKVHCDDIKEHDNRGRYQFLLLDMETMDNFYSTQLTGKPELMVVDPRMPVAIVKAKNSSTMTVVDLVEYEINNIDSVRHALDISVNPLLNTLLVLDKKGFLSHIDYISGELLDKYYGGEKPKTVDVDAMMNIAVIADKKGNRLYLLELPSPAPTINNIEPNSAIAGSDSPKVTIKGSGFFNGSILVVDGHERSFDLINANEIRISLSKTDIGIGRYIDISIMNPPPRGGSSNKAIFTVYNPAPDLYGIDPLLMSAGDLNTVIQLEGQGFLGISEVYISGEKFLPEYIDGSQLNISLPQKIAELPGKHAVSVHNPSPGGGESEPAYLEILPSLNINIISPADSEVVKGNDVIVKGIFESSSDDVGITVNGIVAQINGNSWIAEVPLIPGLNPLTTVIKDSYGNTDSRFIHITSIAQYYSIELGANITSGLAPLKTHFYLNTDNLGPISSYEMDFDGDGHIEHKATTFEDIFFTYSKEGIYYASVILNDINGNQFSEKLAINVYNEQKIDQLLQEKWNEMKRAMINKDVDGALTYFMEHSRERYRHILIQLKEDLPDIAYAMGVIQMIYMNNGIAKYRISRMEGQDLITYYIYIVKDIDGIWRIQQF
ncbi:MAG: hypothetical protein JSV21_04375 [Nitrospirota bacterium]|nr:MAG: hypothetical protein JSV21_04375 [Nitrospirota bacterium]